MVLRKSFYIHWSAGRSSRVHEVNLGRDPSAIPSHMPNLGLGPETRVKQKSFASFPKLEEG